MIVKEEQVAHPQGGPAAGPPLSRATLVLAAVTILVVGMLGGGAVAVLRQPDPQPTPTPSPSPAPASSSPPSVDPSTPAPTSPSPVTPSPSPTPSELTKKEREQQARARLDALAEEGYTTADPRGQWVAQLSSKWIGITDPAQRAQVSGGHTFAAVDIVAEYESTEQLAEQVGGATVVLIKGSDIKKGRDETSGRLFWYVFGVDFASKAKAESWCQDLYPLLSGTRLKNVCFATQLKP